MLAVTVWMPATSLPSALTMVASPKLPGVIFTEYARGTSVTSGLYGLGVTASGGGSGGGAGRVST